MIVIITTLAPFLMLHAASSPSVVGHSKARLPMLFSCPKPFRAPHGLGLG